MTPSLPSLISWIALLAQSISATSAGPRAGRGGWERQGDLLALLSTVTTRLWSASCTHVGRDTPVPLELGFNQGQDGAQGESGLQRGDLPKMMMEKRWQSRDLVPATIPFLLSVDITPAELESQGDDTNTAGIFPLHPDATLGRDCSAYAFFWGVAVMGGTCRGCRRWLCLSLLCPLPTRDCVSQSLIINQGPSNPVVPRTGTSLPCSIVRGAARSCWDVSSLIQKAVQCNSCTGTLIWLLLAEPKDKGWYFPKAPEGLSSIHPCAGAGACEVARRMARFQAIMIMM